MSVGKPSKPVRLFAWAATWVAVTVSTPAGGVGLDGSSLRALVTQVTGDVTGTHETPGQRAPGLPRLVPRPLQRLQELSEFTEIRMPPGAELGLVCADDRWIHLQGPETGRPAQAWVLARSASERGISLPPGTFKSLQPELGRLIRVGGALTLERPTRAPWLEPLIPVLFHPRNTNLLEARPTIVWTASPTAIEYEIEATGAIAFRVELDANALGCRPDPLGLGRTVCSIPWPEDQPELPPGESLFLEVGARTGIARPLRKDDSRPNRIRRLETAESNRVTSQVQALDELPLDASSRALLVGRIFTNAGLYSDAVRAYRSFPDPKPPELWVTVGDLYLETSLPGLAFDCYQKALESLPEPESSDRGQIAAGAAAEQGLGRAHFSVQMYSTSAQHFHRAAELYLRIGVPEEALAASLQAEKAEKRASPAAPHATGSGIQSP